MHASCSTLQVTSNERSNYDIDSILCEINDIKKNISQRKVAEKALDNKDMSRSYWNCASKQEHSFLDGLSAICDKDKNQKWLSLLVEVPNLNKTNSRVESAWSEMVPKVFVILA